ncbi:MAG: rhamnulokinase family protein [Candidatus Acidiferrum sp.]
MDWWKHFYGDACRAWFKQKMNTTERALVAVDLGAQSCRVSLLRFVGGEPEIRVIHRFAHAPYDSGTGLRWDIEKILGGVREGLRMCAGAAPEGIAAIGVDGWGVDYVRLDGYGKRLGDPFCYRDERTTEAARGVYEKIRPEEIYQLTGVQLLNLNTLYQLYADKLAGVDPRARWVTIPEYVTHMLGGRIVSEYTHATHTQLVALGKHEWCEEIFRATGLERSAAPELVPTGTVVGNLNDELHSFAAFRETRLIVPACHDTASAIAAIPATGEDWAFISSGTWSLVGTVLRKPCVTEKARTMNFTNLGGVGGTICFLKNVNGMWLLQQCMEEWAKLGQKWSFEELVRRCENVDAPKQLIDVDAAPLCLPGGMTGKINAQLVACGTEPIAMDERGAVEMAAIIFHSLAKRYSEVLSAVARTAGKALKRLFIVGGGSKNAYLNQLTAKATGLEVIAGSSECTTLGHFAIQLATLQANRADGATAEDVARYAARLAMRPIASNEAQAAG